MPKKIAKIKFRNKTKKVSPGQFPKTVKDLPVTQSMLYGVRDELIFLISGHKKDTSSQFKQVHARFDRMEARFKDTDARFKDIDARFDRVDARFNEIDARFNEVDARFDRMEAKMDRMSAETQRFLVLIEEQHARNGIVFDQLISLFNRQERVEVRVQEFENNLIGLKKS